MTTTTIKTAAEKFRWGSVGFLQFIVDSGEFGITRAEAQAIANRSTTPAAFLAVWEQGGDWEQAE